MTNNRHVNGFGLLPLRKFAMLFFFIISTHISQAQDDNLGWPELMVGYYFQDQLEKCIYLVDKVMANHPGDYTAKEAKAMMFGAYAYLRVDSTKASQIASLIYVPMVDDMIADKNEFISMNREGKKKYIKKFIDSYDLIISFSSLISEKDLSAISKKIDLLNFYHENIFTYRYVFDSSIPEEASSIATIIRQESHLPKLTKRYDILLLNLYTELMSLKQDDSFNTINMQAALETIKNDIIEFGFTEQGKQYLEERTNFLLQYNDLCLKNLGHRATKDWDTITWQAIKNNLGKDECAVIIYDYNLLSTTSINLIGGIVISPELKMPEELNLHNESSSPDELIKELETKYPNCKRFYICPTSKWENIDVAYTNSNIYMKYTLSDLVHFTKSLKYSGGMISLFADIDYGKITNSQEYFQSLNDGKKLINEIRNLFGDKLYCLSGNNVRKINFLNVIDDVSIFHVSTHGTKNAFSSDNTLKDKIGLYHSFVGNTSLMNFGLVLSNFNEDNRNNFISAKDVKSLLRFNKNQLVYLDACDTGGTKENVLGVSGLAKTFYFAGAKNVISYNTEVKETVATDFALSFYKELKHNPTSSYHSIFYNVKKRIIEKYKGTNYIKMDKYGRPNLGILLWE